jgi:hypothetical protein
MWCAKELICELCHQCHQQQDTSYSTKAQI